MFYKATDESPRMFENDFVDGFSRIPWWMVPAVFVPVSAALLGWAAFGAHVAWYAMVVQFALGFFVWTFAEYWLHRTLFHWTPNTWWGPKFHFILHGVHHDYFKDRMRLVMPPAAALALGVLFFGMYWGIAQIAAPVLATSWVFAFFAGKVVGYMNYDLTHYYIHHGKPTLAFYKKLRHHHNNHHHVNPDKRFGVSFTLWDHVFGTFEVEKVARKEQAASAK